MEILQRIAKGELPEIRFWLLEAGWHNFDGEAYRFSFVIYAQPWMVWWSDKSTSVWWSDKSTSDNDEVPF